MLVFREVLVAENARHEQTHRTLPLVVRFGCCLGSIGGFSLLGRESGGDPGNSSSVVRLRAPSAARMHDCRSCPRAKLAAPGYDAVRDAPACPRATRQLQGVRRQDNGRPLGWESTRVSPSCSKPLPSRCIQACGNVKSAAELLGLDWDSVHRIMERAVDRGLERRELGIAPIPRHR